MGKSRMMRAKNSCGRVNFFTKAMGRFLEEESKILPSLDLVQLDQNQYENNHQQDCQHQEMELSFLFDQRH